MKKMAKKLAAILLAVVTVCALCVNAGAVEIEDVSTIFALPGAGQVEGGKLDGAASFESMTVTGTISSQNYLTVHLLLQGDAIDGEFWNDPTACIEYDITLNTDINAVTQMPAFYSGYGWVNPVAYATPITYGKTYTYSTPFTHLYNDAFSVHAPFSLLVQVGANSAEATEVNVTISNIRVVNKDAAAVETAEPAPEQTTAATTTAVTTAATTKATTAATTAATTTTPATTAAPEQTGDFNLGGAIAIVVGGVAVVIVAAIIGYIIYRKKKYY